MYTVYIVFVGKIKYIRYRVFVCSEYKNYSQIFYNTFMYVLSVASVTLNKKGLNHYDEWRRSVFPFIIVFYFEHISVQLVLINVYSCDGLCVSFENKIPF